MWVAAVLGALAVALGTVGSGQGPQPPAEVGQLQPVQLARMKADGPDYEGAVIDATVKGAQLVTGPFPNRRINWWVDSANVGTIRPAATLDQVREQMRKAWQQWADVLDIEPVEVMTEKEAHVKHRLGRIDGVGRVLAWSHLGDGTMRPKEQLYDTGEQWVMGPPEAGRISLYVVATHEIGHAMGLDHDGGAADAIMRPSYSTTITKPTALDIDRMVKLGYKRRTGAPPADPVDTVVSLPGLVKVDDMVAALKRLGYTVTPPVKK